MATEDREREFDAFYRAGGPRVVGLLLATTGDRAVAQECTQEAFARAWADWNRVRTHDDPLAWVRTVARRLAISEWRRGRNRADAHRRAPSPAAAAAPSDDHVAVVTALHRLSAEIRETLVLFYVADLSVERIAEETGAPVGTVKARLHRGRARLAPLLSDDLDTTLTRTEDGHGPR